MRKGFVFKIVNYALSFIGDITKVMNVMQMFEGLKDNETLKKKSKKIGIKDAYTKINRSFEEYLKQNEVIKHQIQSKISNSEEDIEIEIKMMACKMLNHFLDLRLDYLLQNTHSIFRN